MDKTFFDIFSENLNIKEFSNKKKILNLDKKVAF